MYLTTIQFHSPGVFTQNPPTIRPFCGQLIQNGLRFSSNPLGQIDWAPCPRRIFILRQIVRNVSSVNLHFPDLISVPAPLRSLMPQTGIGRRRRNRWRRDNLDLVGKETEKPTGKQPTDGKKTQRSGRGHALQVKHKAAKKVRAKRTDLQISDFHKCGCIPIQWNIFKLHPWIKCCKGAIPSVC